MKKHLVLLSFEATLVVALVIATVFVLVNRAGSPSGSSLPDQQIPTIAKTESPNNESNNESGDNNIEPPTKEIRQSRIGKEVITDFGNKSPIRQYRLLSTPNDPSVGQWWESRLNAPNTVWDMPAPKKQTILAVIDTGIALDHQEFNGRWYENSGEVGPASNENPSELNCTDQALTLDMSCNNVDDNVDGVIDNESGPTTYENPSVFNCTDQSLALDKRCNLIDDDSNGYTDDVTGWDFVNNDASPQAGELFEADNVSTYHATMVTGIAAANANNNLGIAGIDWNTKILPLQSLDDDGYGDSVTVGNAIIYAADMGADVINLSLGTDYPDPIILQAIEYAYDKGVILVASAGNDGCDCMVYPAKYEITLSVGSSNQSDEKSSFSSYGSSLDIVAPGSSMLTTSYSSSNGTSLYSYGSGTSFSAPVVSGLLTLLRGELPNATPLQLAALVTEQANKAFNSGSHKTAQGGYGLINFEDSINRATSPTNFEQIYKYASITNGGVFYGDDKEETVYACADGKLGTTPIYRSSKTKYFYSVNQTDLKYASSNSYSNNPLFKSCILMPHDNVVTAREVNLSREIYNGSSYKSLLKF